MDVYITKHAVERFRERVEDLPERQARPRLRYMLGHTVDLGGRQLRSMPREPGKDYWLHQETGAVFVVKIDEHRQQIKVLTVLFNREEPPRVNTSAKKRHSPHHSWTFGRKHGRPYERRKGGFGDE